VLVAMAATLFMGAKLFGVKRLAAGEARAEAIEKVSSFDENDGIESRGFFWFSTLLFVTFIGVLATTSLIPYIRDLDMGYVALAFAVISLLKFKSSADRFYKGLDWDLLLFFASLFVVINVMEHARVLHSIGDALGYVIGLGPKLGSGCLLAASALASAVTDNIPLAAVLAKILTALPEQADPSLWWSVVFGANLGGNITPIGSASTVVAVTIMHKQSLEISFARFVKLALPFAAMQIVLAIGYVVLFI
jgi:Na+/H+ antiporter NhaD/arsenite permease-like protein